MGRIDDHERIPRREEIAESLDLAIKASIKYLNEVDTLAVRQPRCEEALLSFGGPLPERGRGACESLTKLIGHGLPATVASSGPRCFHFVIGGATPASLAADWLCSAVDQIAYAWVVSPLGVHLEVLCLSWLKELFGLRPQMSGVFTTGATMANFACLASARQWWGRQQGADISQEGMMGLCRPTILSTSRVHASTIKALSMLGIGRASVQILDLGDSERGDPGALKSCLERLKGRPAIVVATAGEPNSGSFDPIPQIVELTRRYNTWLHVDGAFGLFARLSSQTSHLVDGVEHAQSVCVDGHKWLNVPYDCGFAFVADASYLAQSFAYTAEYLPPADDPQPVMGCIGPESSRRARSFSVWATLQAYGREGYRIMVEKHLSLAQRLAGLVDRSNDLERLAPVVLNVVCFRFNPGNLPEESLNALNKRLGEALLEDGRIYVGTTTFRGQVALRPAIVNWRTSEDDIDFFVQVVREVGSRLLGN